MGKNLAECWLCGGKHEYCPTCGQTHGWKYIACTREHYQIIITKRQFESGVLSREQAIEAFEALGVKADSDLSWMIPEVEKKIRDIIGEKPVKFSKTTKKESKIKSFD